jgi:hypothetical protein
MAISKRSKIQALQVLDNIEDHNITAIHTRGALDRMIELVKFPETKKHKDKKGRPLRKRTSYKNQQYDGIRSFLVQNYMLVKYDGYRYHYYII